ncbi:MAG: single-stranded DNA-binding protein [Acidobacteriota bacterium]|nr:single-stranded DNA-binding protein [Acidobacteriota bacterium]
MNTMTITGNLTADPDLRYTSSGKAKAEFTIADNRRRKNPQTGQWEDAGETLFMRCEAWDAHAENIANTLVKGQKVYAVGSVKQENYETRDGQKRTVYKLKVNDIGVVIPRYANSRQASQAARPDAHSENVQWDNPQAGSPWETQTIAPF